MNEVPNNERLLADVLAEGSDSSFREALLGETLHLVRRQRRFRKIRRATSGMAMLAALLLLVWRFVPSPSNIPTSPAKAYMLVRTQPMASGAIVETKPFSYLITSSSTVDIIVTSAAAHDFRFVDDEQLLDLAAPLSPILVRRGPHTAELVFANPADEDAVQ